MHDTIQGLFDTAVAKDKAGEGSEAMRLLDTLLEYQPAHRLGHFYRGGIRIRYRKDPEGGVRDWEAAFGKAPDGSVTQVRKLYTLLVDSCCERLIQFTSQEPDNAIYHSALGRSYLIWGQIDLAQRHLQRALALDKTRGIDAVRLYEALSLSNKNEEGLQIMQKHLVHASDCPELHAQLGFHYQAQAMTAQALKHLETAIKLSPLQLSVHQALGKIYLAQGRMEQAESHFQFMLQHQPCAEAHQGMAECDKQQFRFDQALQHLEEAVNLDPNNFQVITDLAALALQMGQHQLGVNSLKRAIKLKPNQAELYDLLAKAALQQGDLQQAISALTTQLRLNPDDHFAAYTLATQLRCLGQYQEAGQLLHKALSIKSGDVQISLDLAECYEKLNYLDNAKKILQEAFQSNPNHAELQAHLMRLSPETLEQSKSQKQTAPEVEEWMNLARSHIQGERYQEAFEQFRQVLAINPHHSEALLQVGHIYARKKVLEPAAEFFLRSYASDPTQVSILLDIFDLLNQMSGRQAYALLDQLARTLPQEMEQVAWLDYLWRQRQSPGVGKLLSQLVESVKKVFPAQHPVTQRWISLQLADKAATPS